MYCTDGALFCMPAEWLFSTYRASAGPSCVRDVVLLTQCSAALVFICCGGRTAPASRELADQLELAPSDVGPPGTASFLLFAGCPAFLPLFVASYMLPGTGTYCADEVPFPSEAPAAVGTLGCGLRLDEDPPLDRIGCLNRFDWLDGLRDVFAGRDTGVFVALDWSVDLDNTWFEVCSGTVGLDATDAGGSCGVSSSSSPSDARSMKPLRQSLRQSAAIMLSRYKCARMK